MDTDLFGAPINEQPVAPKARVVPSVPTTVKEKPVGDYSSHGSVAPYEWWRSGKNTTVIWSLPPAPPGAAS